MNGYTAGSASIAEAGSKRSVAASPPAGAFFDLAVACRAPARLIRAGIGECACRATAQTDWLLAHLLLDRPYRSAPFHLLEAEEAALFACAAGAAAGEVEAMARLVRVLVLSGLGMTLAGGSEPASQGEHMIAHYVEMMWPEVAASAFHGEQTGVSAIAMAELQERILALEELPSLAPSRLVEADLVARLGPELGAAAWARFSRKQLTGERIDAVNERISRWAELRPRLAAVSRPAEELRAFIAGAGGATRPEDVGWSLEQFRRARASAHLFRDRFTFLDLDAELGPGDRAPAAAD
jgi:glycerol-1-phosphate dehydrogenase [NAD(P)+]